MITVTGYIEKVRVAKPSAWAIVFQVFSTIQRKPWPRLFCQFCSEPTQQLQSRPCAKPAHVAESCLLARLLVLGLSFSDCSKWISRPDTIYQNSWPKPFIDTCYRIGHRLELYLHFTKKFLNPQWFLIEQLIDLRKARTGNLKFRTYLRDIVMDGWSVTRADCSKS